MNGANVPALKCSGDLGLGHCAVSRVLARHDGTLSPGGVKWVRNRCGDHAPRWLHVSQLYITTGDLAFTGGGRVFATKAGWGHGPHASLGGGQIKNLPNRVSSPKVNAFII